jgi:hypothetical protein
VVTGLLGVRPTVVFPRSSCIRQQDIIGGDLIQLEDLNSPWELPKRGSSELESTLIFFIYLICGQRYITLPYVSLYPNLVFMSNLTYIAFNSVHLSAALYLLLETLPRIQCIVFLCLQRIFRLAEFREGKRHLASMNNRFVHIDHKNYDAHAHGGNDYWNLAEAFIATRRANKVKRERGFPCQM